MFVAAYKTHLRPTAMRASLLPQSRKRAIPALVREPKSTHCNVAPHYLLTDLARAIETKQHILLSN